MIIKLVFDLLGIVLIIHYKKTILEELAMKIHFILDHRIYIIYATLFITANFILAIVYI